MAIPDVEDRLHRPELQKEMLDRVAPCLDDIREKEPELKEKLKQLILKDMLLDLALSDALNEVSEVVEFLAQERSIERPSLRSEALLRSLSRISSVNMSLEFAGLIGMEESAVHEVLRAEIARLWFDPKKQPDKTSTESSSKLELPAEAVSLLRSIAKAFDKKAKTR